MTTQERFWSKVLVTESASECWIWQASCAGNGYGQFRLVDKVPCQPAHRFAYEQVNGAIPGGLTIDHLCRRPLCCNPSHLEAVTNRENNIRAIPFADNHAKGARERAKTHCPRGHGYTPENTYVHVGKKYTKRYCKACRGN